VLYQIVLFPVTLNDPNYPKPFSTFYIALHIFVVSGVKDFNLVNRLTVASARTRMAKGRG